MGVLSYRKLLQIQERIPTLNSEQDYQLQVTTITGLDKNTKTVTIYNKNHKEIKSLQQDQPVNTSKEPVNSRIEEIDIENSFDENNDDDISLANAIQEFLEEVDYMEAKPIKGGQIIKFNFSQSRVNLANWELIHNMKVFQIELD